MSLLTTIFIFCSNWLLTSTSDLQPSTAILNQSLWKSTCTQNYILRLATVKSQGFRNLFQEFQYNYKTKLLGN